MSVSNINLYTHLAQGLRQSHNTDILPKDTWLSPQLSSVLCAGPAPSQGSRVAGELQKAMSSVSIRTDSALHCERSVAPVHLRPTILAVYGAFTIAYLIALLSPACLHRSCGKHGVRACHAILCIASAAEALIARKQALVPSLQSDGLPRLCAARQSIAALHMISMSHALSCHSLDAVARPTTTHCRSFVLPGRSWYTAASMAHSSRTARASAPVAAANAAAASPAMRNMRQCLGQLVWRWARALKTWQLTVVPPPLSRISHF